MPGYAQTERAPQEKPAQHEHHAGGHGHAATDVRSASLNRSPRSQSLLQLRAALNSAPGVQAQAGLERALNTAPVQKKPNATGLPDRLKAGVESLSGLSMDDVRVHYNSAKPAAVQAHAYAQGIDIHVAPRQERHLPHEAWHVVQQKQGRMKPTLQMKGVATNDDAGLEWEADRKADDSHTVRPQIIPKVTAGLSIPSRILRASIQRKITEDEDKQKPYPIGARAKRMPALIEYRLSDEQLAKADALHEAETLYSPSEVAESVGARPESKFEKPTRPAIPRPQGPVGGRTARFQAQTNLDEFLLKMGGDFAAAEHQIVTPIPVRDQNNCHGFTVTDQRNKFMDPGEFLEKIGKNPAVVFVKGGRIGHSGKLLAGNKLHHLLIGVGEVISEIRGNMGYDGRYDLPEQRPELDKYLQPKLVEMKIYEMLGGLTNFENEGELKGDDLKNVQDLRQHLYDLQDIADTGQIPEEFISQYVQLTQEPDLKAETAEDTSDSDLDDLPDLEPA